MVPTLPPLLLEYEKPAIYEPLPGCKTRLLGIPRSVLLELHEVGLIRIFDVHSPGRRTPLRLVHIPTLVAFIERNERLVDQLVDEVQNKAKP